MDVVQAGPSREIYGQELGSKAVIVRAIGVHHCLSYTRHEDLGVVDAVLMGWGLW